MYYPAVLARELTEVDENDEAIIALKKEKKGVPFQIENEKVLKTDKGFVIQKSEGTQVFQIEPEHLRTDAGIEVYTDLTSPTIPEVKKAQTLELFQAIPNLATAYETPWFWDILKSKLPPQKMIEQLFDLFGVDYDNIETDQKEVARKALDEFIKGLNWEAPPPTGPWMIPGIIPPGPEATAPSVTPPPVPGADMANPARILQRK